jgi:hypothetical protein
MASKGAISVGGEVWPPHISCIAEWLKRLWSSLASWFPMLIITDPLQNSLFRASAVVEEALIAAGTPSQMVLHSHLWLQHLLFSCSNAFIVETGFSLIKQQAVVASYLKCNKNTVIDSGSNCQGHTHLHPGSSIIPLHHQ